MSFKPLLRIFEGKMRSAELMAYNKGLEFVVEDKTTATDAGNTRSRKMEVDIEMSSTSKCEYTTFEVCSVNVYLFWW